MRETILIAAGLTMPDGGSKPVHRYRDPLAVILSGFMVVLAAPPFNCWPLAFVSIIPFYLVIKDASPMRSAVLGWLLGLVLLLVGTFWWVGLLGRFAHLSFPASLVITILLCGYQALTYGLWAGSSRFFNFRYGMSWFIAGPLCLALAEMLVPFPFKMYFAIMIWRVWPLTQLAELGGPPVVSALLLLINIVLAETLLAVKKRQPFGCPVRYAALACAALLLLGLLRVWHIDFLRETAPSLYVGVVQPNFGTVSVEERKQHGEQYIQELRQATLELGRQGAELIIWPETAWPFLFDRQITMEYPPGHPWAMRPGVKGRLLLGTLSHHFGGSDVYNSAVLVAEDGVIVGRYDKTRLVPFSENIPLAATFPDWAEAVRKQTPLWPDIVPGHDPQLLIDKKLRIGSFICSEDIDPGYGQQLSMQNPNLLVSLASDAWFGKSGGAEQHLALASFRAIEARRDLVRATNNGISAFVDATGRISVSAPSATDAEGQRPLPVKLLAYGKLLETPSLAGWVMHIMPLLYLVTLFVVAQCRQTQRKNHATNAARRGGNSSS